MQRKQTMRRKEKDLVILAAGIGSRFKGSIKQLRSVGPAGECIMDYSIYDAVHAGFTRIVFIIRRDIEALFEEQIGKRVRHFCRSYGVEVMCVYQEKEKLPDGYICPAIREKPWGTGHALLCCRGALQGKFAVINADDFYGREAFLQMAKYLDSLDDKCSGPYALAGFRLSNTLSSHGGVTRGLCKMDSEDMFTSIQETKNIYKDVQGPYTESEDSMAFIVGARTRTPLNATLRGSVACRRLDGGNTCIFSRQSERKCKRIPHPNKSCAMPPVGVVFFIECSDLF